MTLIQRAYGFQPYLELDSEQYQLTPTNIELMAGTTPRAFNMTLEPAHPSPESCHTWNARNPLPESCEGLTVGVKIIVQLVIEEREDNLDKDWFVAKIEEDAKKLDEEEVYTAVH